MISSRRNSSLSCQILTGEGCKCFLIVYSLLLGKPSCHEPCFIILDTSINCMFDFRDPSRSDHRLSFHCRHDVPYIIVYDGAILLYHGISPNLFIYSVLKSGMLRLTDTTCQCQIIGISGWWSTLLESDARTLHMLLSICQCLRGLSRSPPSKAQGNIQLILQIY